jgi:hypothetical protein
MTTRCRSCGRRRLVVAPASLLVVLAAAACSSDRQEPTPTSGSQVGVGVVTSSGAGGSGGQGGDASATSGGEGGASSGAGGAGASGGGTVEGTGAGGGGGPPICFPSEGPFGDVAVEALEPGACGAPGGSAVDVAPIDAIPGYFDRMVSLGQSRIAGGEESLSGPIWLDDDGGSPDAESFYPGGTGLAVQGDVVAILGDALAVQRFGADRQAIGSEVQIGELAGGAQGIATSGDGWLVAWEDGGDIVARRVDPQHPPREEPRLVEGAALSESASMALRGAGDRAAIVYAGEKTGDWRLGVVRVGSEGYSEPVDAACGTEPIRVVDVEALDDGWLVLTRNRDRDTSFLVRLGADGLAVPPAVELVGAPDPYGLRRSGDAVGVVAELASGQPALRSFDATTLAPLGGWVCLAGADAGGWPIAIDADDGGFAVLHANEAGGLRMTRTDRTGEGP